MDFRAHQDAARASTRRLVALFLLLMGLVGLLFAVVVLAAVVLYDTSATGVRADSYLHAYWHDLWPIGAFAAGLAALWVLGGSVVQWVRDTDGQQVAERMGGVVLDEGMIGRVQALAEQQQNPTYYEYAAQLRETLNAYDEMVIASSLPRPTLYVLAQEESINAFAAGAREGEFVVALTYGAIKNLAREERAAVLAHELGHIAHQDVRLNMRLAAMIFGLSSLTLMARFMFYRAHFRGEARERLALYGIAAGIFVLGLVSAFAGRLLQAAVSRQREFLADATAVQFTRNPEAMRGVLQKIAGIKDTALNDPHARQYGHAFLFPAFRGFFKSHPPIEERLARLGRVRPEQPAPASRESDLFAER